MERVEGVPGAPVLVFQAVASSVQRMEAQIIADSFDWSEAADKQWREQQRQLATKQQAIAMLHVSNDPALLAMQGMVAEILKVVEGLRHAVDSLVKDYNARLTASVSVPAAIPDTANIVASAADKLAQEMNDIIAPPNEHK